MVLVCRFYIWVGHGKRPEPEGHRSFAMANPGKKAIWASFVVYQAYTESFI